jgi:hypothetical protein
VRYFPTLSVEQQLYQVRHRASLQKSGAESHLVSEIPYRTLYFETGRASSAAFAVWCMAQWLLESQAQESLAMNLLLQTHALFL